MNTIVLSGGEMEASVTRKWLEAIRERERERSE